MSTPRREIPNAEIEAGYRALVELGVPISRAEIVAVLEAAEGARGVSGAEAMDVVNALARLIVVLVLEPTAHPSDRQDAAEHLASILDKWKLSHE